MMRIKTTVETTVRKKLKLNYALIVMAFMDNKNLVNIRNKSCKFNTTKWLRIPAGTGQTAWVINKYDYHFATPNIDRD